MKQLEDNLRALDVVLSAEHRARLDTVSAITLCFPHDPLRQPVIMQSLTGGTVLPARTRQTEFVIDGGTVPTA